MSLAHTDDEGFFTANDVVEPYSAIMKEKKRIAHFEKHLRRFSYVKAATFSLKGAVIGSRRFDSLIR